MNDKQLNEILDLIRVNYKNFFKNESSNDKILVLKSWKYQFNNVPQDIMFQAIMQYMATETQYPPSIAHINKIIYGMTQKEVLGAEESFTHIRKLIERYGSDGLGYNRAINKFTDIEKQVVSKEFFKELGLSTDPYGVVLGQYTRRYNHKLESIERNDRVALPNVDILKLMHDRKLIE